MSHGGGKVACAGSLELGRCVVELCTCTMRLAAYTLRSLRLHASGPGPSVRPTRVGYRLTIEAVDARA